MPRDHSCSTCPVGGKNLTVSDNAWLRQRFSERFVSQFRALRRLSACQSHFVCLWADSQEDRPLVGSHLLAFTNGGSYGSGGLVDLIFRNKYWRHTTEEKRAGRTSGFRLSEKSGITQGKTWRILKLFFNVYFPHICYFISCVCMIWPGKPNVEGTSGPKLGKWRKAERRTGSHPQLASGGTRRKALSGW